MKNINEVQLNERDSRLLKKIKQAVHKILHEKFGNIIVAI